MSLRQIRSGSIIAEAAAWEQRRNAEGALIQWMFTTEKARENSAKLTLSKSHNLRGAVLGGLKELVALPVSGRADQIVQIAVIGTPTEFCLDTRYIRHE